MKNKSNNQNRNRTKTENSQKNHECNKNGYNGNEKDCR